MTAIGQQADRTWFGHPKGVFFLAATEMWERFSFYGMSALLLLYLTEELLQPAHAAKVLGLAPLRSVIEFFGPMTDYAFASMLAGLYGGFVYFTPILGGWIADRLLGAKRTVMIGVLLMSIGHLTMSFYSTFLLALVLLILGSGCLKGNISGQVGTLYPREAESQRTRGFAIFSTGINIGAVSGPLATGGVAAIYGWHAGFALAAGLMLMALVVYALAQKHLPEDRPAKQKVTSAPPLTIEERKRVMFLLLVVALTIPAEITYPMVWNTGIYWVKHQVDLTTSLGTVPASWFSSVDSLGAIIAAPILLALWPWQARRANEPTSVTKIGIGTVLAGLAAIIISLGNIGTTGPGQVPVWWALGGYLLMGLAWMYYWPTTLALVSRCAPPAIASTLMGLAFLSPFAAHITAGYVGGFYDKMSPTAFWIMDAAIGFAGGALILALRGWLNAGVSPSAEAEHRPPMPEELEGEKGW